MSRDGLLQPRLWWLLGWLGIVLLLVLSLAPLPGASLVLRAGDKYLHALSYCVTMLWFVQLTARPLLLMIALISLGAMIELLQGFTEFRHPDLFDAAANSAGVIAGWLFSLTPLGRSLRWLDRAVFRRPRE